LAYALRLRDWGDKGESERRLVRAKQLLDIAWERSTAEACEGDRDDDGIVDSMDMCPDQAESFNEINDTDGCPETDSDGDGVDDAIDRCPGIWGAPSSGGCPAGDRDADGVPDGSDECPETAGPKAYDGCPYRYVLQEDGRLITRRKIQFHRRRVKVAQKSYRVLNDIVSYLRTHSDIQLRIESHTDSNGAASRNRRLSERRAQAVRGYLVRKGIAPDRLRAVGFGESQPLYDNSTASGRKKNNRLEFVILTD
tara:strand:+ start:139 stop:897 length:759 start_codon:yes stop_codon:yes gene_type:complete